MYSAGDANVCPITRCDTLIVSHTGYNIKMHIMGFTRITRICTGNAPYVMQLWILHRVLCDTIVLKLQF